MATILDQLREQQPDLQVPGITDQTQRVASLLRAKATGKALGAPAIAGSAVGEQVANQQATQEMQNQIAPAIQMQTARNVQKAAGIESEAKYRNQVLDQAAKLDTVRNRVQLNSVLNELSREKGKLGTEREAAALEQAGFLMGLQDKQYVTNLQQVGATRRLGDKFQMLGEMQDLVFGDHLDLLKSKLAVDNVLYSSRRDFQQAMADIDTDDAINIAAIEAKYRAKQAGIDINKITRIGKTAASAAEIAGRYGAYADILSAGLKATDKAMKPKSEGGLGMGQEDGEE